VSARAARRRTKLRLAVVCYPTFGGSGVVATELGLALAARGHQVHVISTEFPARLRIVDGLTFHRVPVVTYPLFQYPPYTLALATKVAQVIRQERLDLVHAHYAIPHSVAVFLGQQMGGCEVKTVTTLHGTDVQLVGLDPSYWEITRFGMLRSSGLTAVSQALADTTQREFHLDREVRVIPNFVDTARFCRPRDAKKRAEIARPGEKVLLHVSNFRPVKRVWEVVAAFSRIAAKIPAQLYMIGDGPDRPRAEAAARELGVENRVHCLKAISDVEEWYGAADLLLHPSEMESFGLAPLEAMACGVPVLA
jgi:N-acetyl-alpha-D-glucosaminyl L-malate synthase BshA